jgi:hypothetical protein
MPSCTGGWVGRGRYRRRRGCRGGGQRRHGGGIFEATTGALSFPFVFLIVFLIVFLFVFFFLYGTWRWRW